MMARISSLLTACLLAAFSAQAQQPQKVSLSALPESGSISPGKSLVLAVKLDHLAGHHSYWVNPGGPGKGTTFKVAPEGFSVASVQWPVPHLHEDAGVTTYTYEGSITALVTLTAPADAKVGEAVTVELTAKGLVCSDSCMPFTAKLLVQLSISAEPGAATVEGSAAVAEARKHLPAVVEGWSFSAVTEEKTQQLALWLSPQAGAEAELKAVRFFNAEEVIDSQKPQVLEKKGSAWLLRLPAMEDAEVGAELKGILQAERWLTAKPELKAFSIQLPISTGSLDAAPASTAAAAGSSDASAAAPVGAEGQGLSSPLLLLYAFLGGLILNVMPCVFPVLGIKIMGFVNQAGGDKRQVLLHGLAYTLGVLVCFWALALFVITLGKGWGAQLQEPWFVLLLTLFFLAFGLNMAGVFEVGTSATGVGQDLQHKGGLGGTFFSGLLATVVATPCSAPFLGPALAWAISLPVGTALLVFTVIGLGLSSPYLILSLAPSLLRLLPRPGAWMESFKQGMSFLLFGTSGYMLFIFAGLVPAEHLLPTLLAMTLVAFGCWVYGRWCLPHLPRGTQLRSAAVALLALLGGVALSWPPSVQEKKEALQWIPWTPGLPEAMAAEGDIVYVDFTARWCSTCLLNKRVYKDPVVKDLFAKHKVKLVKADWTDNNEEIAKALFEHKAAAIPLNVIYTSKQPPLVFNDDNLFTEEILAAFNKLGLE
jgi:thiol:disulfide interchange protein/DsbC/DsbD-like thiol-disulfide interchange protein